jgi:protein-tyrosine phosphatase
MIDIHTHILPAVDDGSGSAETSLQQLTLMAQSGVTDVVLTPHYQREGFRIPREERDAKRAALQTGCQAAGLSLTLHHGSEVYLDTSIWRDIEDFELCINDTPFVLVETGMTLFPENLYEVLYYLVRKGYRPILAHPERYRPIYTNPQLAEDFLHRDVYLQINAGSLLGHYGKMPQRCAWQLLEHGHAHFMASDNHCRSGRYPMVEACERIAHRIDDHLPQLLTQINPQKMLNNEDIPFFYMEKHTSAKRSFLQKILGFGA